MTVRVERTAREMVREMIVSYEKYVGNDLRSLDNVLNVTHDLWVGCVGDDPVCAWGLVPPTLLSDEAYLWMIVLEGAESHTFCLVRHSQIQMEEMLKLYGTIRGHCEVGNARAQCWLKWLGADFGYPEGTLIPFAIRRRADG